MSFTSIQNAFSGGELAPSLYGRTDLAKFHQAGSTVRNMFVNYRGGATSRAGTAYVGMCKQGAPNGGGTPTNNPPRDINFQFSNTQGDVLEFGDNYMRIKSTGGYVTEPSKAITGITNANPGVFICPSHGYATGDWAYIAGIVGMTEFNGLSWIINVINTNEFYVTDLFGVAIDTTGFPLYVSGGIASRIYTLATPYAAIDLPYLKFAQSADTMTLACVNTSTLTEYPSYELERTGPANWTLTQDTFTATISPPTGVVATRQSTATLTTWYAYVVTAVDSSTGEESVSSYVAQIDNNDISIYAGSNNITWNQANSASSYNIYAAIPSLNQPVAIGVSFGYIGTAFGTSFTDTNIVPDFTKVPPVHQNPFAPGAISFVQMTATGSGYTQSGVGWSITTAAGVDFDGIPIVLAGAVVAFLIFNGGQNYQPGDTIAFTGGTGATATLDVGPDTGTYPSLVSYFQQRRAYAATLNNPDTYFLSQPGAYLNMDSGVPTVDSDAIVGTPWAQQINGIEFMVPMPGGLVILAGKGAWQLTGGNSVALTPSDQTATPQAYNGCSSLIPPIPVNFHILYVQSKGSIVRDLSYNFFANIYTGTDMTVLSSHLFTNYTLIQWAWAEEPYKLVWAVRDDGTLLSFTYLQEQEVYAWARHDTNGVFIGVCSITEPPVDAVYLIVQRFVRGQWVYYSERMDNRLWQDVGSSWCVDCGLAYPMATPNATLTAVAADGTSNITNTNLVIGGTNYTAPTASAVDQTGVGNGATFSVTVVAGVITAVTPLTSGSGYTPGATQIEINDATGSGAVVYPVITNIVQFNASAAVFNGGDVGDVIRIGGGVATITSYVSPTQIYADITQPISLTVPNDPNNTPKPVPAGKWTISTPTSTIVGLNHLEGLQVAILADGSVQPSQTVVNGAVALQNAASQIIIGLPFTAQLQTMYLDPPGQPVTVQGKRKTIPSVTVRCEASRGFSVGANQPDAATQPYQAAVPWVGMQQVKERNALVTAGSAIPLFTGDIRTNIPSDWKTPGQVAVQQSYNLPLTVLAVIPEYIVGDSSG